MFIAARNANQIICDLNKIQYNSRHNLIYAHKNRGHFVSEVSSFIYPEFRRIYGVVFRTLLHGEAEDYLLAKGPTFLCIIDACSGLGINLGYVYQANCHK